MSSSSRVADNVSLTALLRFPREIRDMIYPYLVSSSEPIELKSLSARPHPFTDPEKSHPIIAAEALEAYYANNTFFAQYKWSPNEVDSTSTWGPHRTLLLQHCRHLIVSAPENVDRLRLTREDEEANYNAPRIAFWNTLMAEDEEDNYKSSRIAFWTTLLLLPRLRSLTIGLQKSHSNCLIWEDFAPVLFTLRAQLPNIHARIDLSFDNLLRNKWEDSYWLDFGNSAEPYEEMGYIDVTHLFERPTQEDREYVAEYLPEKVMPNSPNAVQGLLDYTPAERRQLGQHYVVKEPQLLRVLMQEAYEEFDRQTRAAE